MSVSFIYMLSIQMVFHSMHLSFQLKLIVCDSSLDGGGGNTDKWCYTWMYTEGYKE